MIIVTGTAQARPDTLHEMLALSLEHVRRSRLYPGCISHAVHMDAQDPLKLVFVEQWADKATLLAHFGVPESRAFGKALYKLAAAAPQMQTFEAEEVKLI